MTCTYTLGKKKYSYEALYDHVLNNFEILSKHKKLKGVNIYDIIYSNALDREQIVERLYAEKSTVGYKNRKYSHDVGEVFDTVDQNNYIDLHTWVETGSRVVAEANKLSKYATYVTQYNESELRTQTIQKFKQQGSSQQEAEQQTEHIFQGYKKIEETAYDLHIAINLFFKGFNEPETLRAKLSEIAPQSTLYTKELIDSLIRDLNKIKSYIFKTIDCGEDYKNVSFLPNYPIEASINGTDKKLYSNIDLVVVDAKGVPHIFLFKSSAEMSSLQPEVKKSKQNYYLAFDRQLLASKNIDVSKSSLNVVPMKIDLDSSNNVIGVTMENPEDRRSKINKDGSNDLTYGSGKLWTDANAVIPVLLTELKIDGSIKETVIDNLYKFFPTANLKRTKESQEVKAFIAEKVRRSSDPNYAWEFDDEENGMLVFIKEESAKENNTELYDKVIEYLNSFDINREKTLNYLMEGIKKVIAGKLELHKLLKYSTGLSKLNISLGKYTNGAWIVPDNLVALEELGILVLQNRFDGQIDIINLSTSFKLNQPLNLGLGTTILGAHKNNVDLQNDKSLLSATQGNIELMKVMLALNELAEKSNLQNVKIGDIKILNLKQGESTSVHPNLLRHSFNKLCQETKLKNLTQNLKWMNEIELLKTQVATVLSSSILNDEAPIKTIFSDLEKINTFDQQAAIEALVKIVKTLETTYSELIVPGNWEQSLKNAAGSKERLEILNLYILANTAVVYMNDNFYELRQMHTIGTVESGDLFNGRLVTTADVIVDKNIETATNAVRNSHVLIRDRFSNFADKFFYNTVEPLHKSKGYSHTQNTIVGNQNPLYKNIFRRNNEGKLNEQMLFKNPYDPAEDLQPAERQFLKEVLWIINRRRFNLEGFDENSKEVKEKMSDPKWFWVPLMEAQTSSKLTTEAIKEKLSYESKEIISGIKRTKEAFKRDEEGLYTETEEFHADNLSKRYEMLNRFDLSDHNQSTRTELLQSQPLSFWETNVETIVLSFEEAYIRKEVLDAVLPIIKSIRFITEAFGDQAGINTKENVKFLDDYLKQAVFNRSILSDEEKVFSGYLKKARVLTSTLMIAGNVVAPIRDTMEGVWKAMNMFIRASAGEQLGFGKADYLWAVKTLLGDNIKSINMVTVCEALNQRFGIANMDINILAKRARSSKTGLFNFRDKLFWTSTAGDYFNRMSLLLARMHHDGSFQACSFDKGFKYDWRKDKRFEQYAQGSGPKYNEQKALYLSMLQDFNEQGYKLKPGDDLPMPYTPKEVVFIKSQADQMYGYYDHDIRMQVEKTALGQIFMQFSTYLTALKTQWFKSKKLYDSPERVQAIDEKTGLPLYWKEDKDADGNTIYILTTEVTDTPYMVQGQTYMEGIFYTLYDIYKDCKAFRFRKAFSDAWNLKYKRQNLMSLSYQILMWVVIGNIIKYLLSLWGDQRKNKKEPNTVFKAIKDQGFSTLQRALNGSLASYNLIDAFGGNILSSEPPMIGMATKMFTSTSKVLTGDKNLDYWFKTNVAAYRSVGSLITGLQKVGEPLA